MQLRVITDIVFLSHKPFVAALEESLSPFVGTGVAMTMQALIFIDQQMPLSPNVHLKRSVLKCYILVVCFLTPSVLVMSHTCDSGGLHLCTCHVHYPLTT